MQVEYQMPGRSYVRGASSQVRELVRFRFGYVGEVHSEELRPPVLARARWEPWT